MDDGDDLDMYGKLLCSHLDIVSPIALPLGGSFIFIISIIFFIEGLLWSLNFSISISWSWGKPCVILDSEDNSPFWSKVSYSLNFVVVQNLIVFGFDGCQYFITDLVAVVPKKQPISVLSTRFVRCVPCSASMWYLYTLQSYIILLIPYHW